MARNPRRIRVNGRLYEAVNEDGLTKGQIEQIKRLREDAAAVNGWLVNYDLDLAKVKRWLKPGDLRTYDYEDDLLDVIDTKTTGTALTFDHIEYVLERVYDG